MKSDGEKSRWKAAYDGSGSGSHGREGARQRSVEGAPEGDRGQGSADPMDEETAKGRGVK